MIRIGSRSTGRPTLNEVARLAAVSPITASRALRGVTTVAPELVEKVRAAAQSLGYVANPAARALASSCSQTVVVLVPSLSNQLFIETLEAIQDVLRPRGLDVVIGNYHYSPEEEEKLLRNHLVNRPRGILLTGFDRTPASHQMLEASRIPCVHMM
ncbi:LacI family DNA-binding transcriptional regulator, partial [Pseudomonas viridiflava]